MIIALLSGLVSLLSLGVFALTSGAALRLPKIRGIFIMIMN